VSDAGSGSEYSGYAGPFRCFLQGLILSNAQDCLTFVRELPGAKGEICETVVDIFFTSQRAEIVYAKVDPKSTIK
jgi:hypothetical protein